MNTAFSFTSNEKILRTPLSPLEYLGNKIARIQAIHQMNT